jgi:hypothetical protein
VIGEYLSVSLVLVAFDLFQLYFLGCRFALEDGVSDLSAPLADGFHADEGVVFALLDCSCVEQQVVLHEVELIVGESLLPLSEDEPVSDFQTDVVLELLNRGFERVSLLFLVFCQFDECGQSAGPDCAFLQINLGNDVLEKLATDVLLAGFSADDA